jgi:glycosyltransferase involved in cell wall biosynthesis
MARDVSRGGTERYLDLLNRLLLDRYRMTIIQTYDTDDPATAEEQTEVIGKGQLVWVPIGIKKVPRRSHLSPLSLTKAACRHFRNHSSWNNRGRTGKRFQNSMRSLTAELRHSTELSYEKIFSKIASTRIDLAALHWLDFDVDPIATEFARRKIPFVLINHYRNTKYRSLPSRRTKRFAAGFAGISSVEVPEAIRKDYVNLSDAVGPEFSGESPPSCFSSLPKIPGVLLVGRITPGKGHLDALRAVATLKEQGKPVELIFAGAEEEPQYAASVRKAADRLGITPQVKFLGQVSDLRQTYRDSALVILPSSSEGLGRVLLEAQAMEKAVVAYNVGGVREALLPGETGLLIQSGEHQALTKAIESLLDHPARMTEMGKRGRIFVLENFSCRTLLNRHEDFYLRAMEKNPK